MDSGLIVIILAVFTLVVFAILAVISKEKTEQRLADEDTKKSTLAADKSSTGEPPDV